MLQFVTEGQQWEQHTSRYNQQFPLSVIVNSLQVTWILTTQIFLNLDS